MLRVGLTGGIGSGKSTVARRLVGHGAVLIDSDVLAREVVEPGTDGLAEIVDAFGPAVLDHAGALDRPALAAVVFGDGGARERLNGIVHPRVRRRSDELIAAAPGDAVVVQDIPLLVEGAMGSRFPLVVVVHAAPEERIDRLVRQRGMTESDARARVGAQADDAARRAAADVWLDNSGAPAALEPVVDALWRERLLPFEENLRRERPAALGRSTPVEPDPGWPAAAARLVARIEAAVGNRGRGAAHVGPTAVPGMPAADVLDLVLGVDPGAEPGALRAVLAAAGFPPGPGARSSGRFASADPGRPARLLVLPVDSPEWRSTLLHRDWLRAGAPGMTSPRPAQRPLPDTLNVAERWAARSGWVPSTR